MDREFCMDVIDDSRMDAVERNDNTWDDIEIPYELEQ